MFVGVCLICSMLFPLLWNYDFLVHTFLIIDVINSVYGTDSYIEQFVTRPVRLTLCDAMNASLLRFVPVSNEIPAYA